MLIKQSIFKSLALLSHVSDLELFNDAIRSYKEDHPDVRYAGSYRRIMISVSSGEREEISITILRIHHIDPDGIHSYEALMEFYDITASDTSSTKIHGLNEWIYKYRESDCPPLRRSVHSIETHKRGIINAWKYLKSNAHTESLNRDIKNVKHLIYINQCPLRRR